MKILVVDDQAANRGLLSYLLEEDGHEVIEASNGEEGIKKFDDQVPDLVLMDVMMPGMDGYQTVELIKSRSKKHVPIIFLTALSDDLSLSRCIESGGDDFLTKPVNEILLSAKIKAHERIRDLNLALNNQNNELERFHALLKQENELAEYVYDTAISKNLDCKNVKSYLSPMGGFSGDVIFTERTNRGTLFIMLGDFTGHGLPAALGALPISQQFKFLAQRGVSLGDMAEQLNLTLYNYLPGHMFCAANLIELNNDGSQINCWLGGLPDILLIDDQGRIRKALKSHHMALGVVSEKSFKRDVITVNLKKGERLIVYSDGVTDCCDVNGEMLGEARFELMFDGKVKGDDLFADLVDRIKAFGEGRPQDDDVSILEVVAGTSEEMIAKSYSDPGSRLPWRLSTKIELRKHRDMDLIAKVMDLFANRTWLRSKKDQLYNTVVTQLRRLIDLQILKADWQALGLEDEDEHRQIERLKLMDKIEDCPIFLDIWYQPEKSLLQIVVSDHFQQPKSDLVEYKSEIIDAQKISFVNKMEGTLSLATETLIY